MVYGIPVCLVFPDHRLVRENQKAKLIIQETRVMLSWQMFWFMVGCYHSLPAINNTGKWITGALSCPFKIDLPSQTVWVDLPGFSFCGWFTAHKILSTRTTLSWLMAAKLALQLREECPEVVRPLFRLSRASEDDGPQQLLTKVPYLPQIPRESTGRKRPSLII